MSKYLTYKRNSHEYESIINSFLDKIEATFDGYYQRDELRNLLYQNLKKIKKIKNVTSIKLPIIGYINGTYHRILRTMIYTDNEDETIEHELFHALSAKATAKRESLFKILAIVYLGQKQLSTRELEEGITEYLTGCITGEAYKNIGFVYQTEKNVVNKLAAIYGNRVILDYYLGLNNNLIELINYDNPQNFKKLNRMLQKAATTSNIPDNFEGTKYPGKKNETFEDNLIFELFSKEKLRKINTVDDFKHNLHELFKFYESDLYRVCYSINEEEIMIQQSVENGNKDNLMQWYQSNLNKKLQEFAKFDNIIRKEWQKLGINDEILYSNLLLDCIETFNEFATPIIIDYIEYWSRDLATIYNERNTSIAQHKVSSSQNTSSELEQLKALKSNLKEIPVLKESFSHTDSELTSRRK